MDIEIPENIMKRLKLHEEQFGIPLNELIDSFLTILPEVQIEYPKSRLDIQMNRAYRRLWSKLKKAEGGIGSKAVMHTAFFIGETGLVDTIDKMRKKILRMPEEEQKYYHPEEDVFLDYREKTHGELLKGELWTRTFYGIGNLGKEFKNPKFIRLEAWRDAAKTLEYSLHNIFHFRAIPKFTDRQLGYLYLGATDITRMKLADWTITDEEKEEYIRNCGKPIYTLDDLEMLYNMTVMKPGEGEEERIYRDPEFIEADVYQIRFREGKSTKIGIDDLNYLDTDTVAYVPQYLPLDFGEGSRVIFLATFGKQQLGYEEKIVLYVKGYFSLPSTRTKPL